jgi:hypothetical protein
LEQSPTDFVVRCLFAVANGRQLREVIGPALCRAFRLYRRAQEDVRRCPAAPFFGEIISPCLGRSLSRRLDSKASDPFISSSSGGAFRSRNQTTYRKVPIRDLNLSNKRRQSSSPSAFATKATSAASRLMMNSYRQSAATQSHPSWISAAREHRAELRIHSLGHSTGNFSQAS